MLANGLIHFPVRPQFSRHGPQTPLPSESFFSRRGSHRCLFINQSQCWSRTSVKWRRTSRAVVRASYARRPMETPGAYQLIDNETGEKFIVWGGIDSSSSNIPSKEVLYWNPHINKKNNRTAAGRNGDRACIRGLTSCFGRLKAQRVRDILNKTHRMKQNVNERDFDELIMGNGPFHVSISSHSEHRLLDKQKGLDILNDRRNVSSVPQSQETRDMVQKVVTREDMEHSEVAIKHEVEQLQGYQIRPTNSQESDIQLARRDVSVSRVSAATLRGWGNGESVCNFRYNVDISMQRQKLTADSDFFSRKSFRDLGCSDYMIESLRSQLFVRPSSIQAMAFAPIFGGKSCIIADQSGSGKTLAYLVPIIQRLRQEELQGLSKSLSQSPRVVILVPTAELASQVANLSLLCWTNFFICARLSSRGNPCPLFITSGRRCDAPCPFFEAFGI